MQRTLARRRLAGAWHQALLAAGVAALTAAASVSASTPDTGRTAAPTDSLSARPTVQPQDAKPGDGLRLPDNALRPVTSGSAGALAWLATDLVDATRHARGDVQAARCERRDQRRAIRAARCYRSRGSDAPAS